MSAALVSKSTMKRSPRQANPSPVWQVNSKQAANVSICGYLHKYTGSRAGLLSQSWHSRFFTLNGTALQYYRTENDTGAPPPQLAWLEAPLESSNWSKEGACTFKNEVWTLPRAVSAAS